MRPSAHARKRASKSWSDETAGYRNNESSASGSCSDRMEPIPIRTSRIGNHTTNIGILERWRDKDAAPGYYPRFDSSHRLQGREGGDRRGEKAPGAAGGAGT